MFAKITILALVAVAAFADHFEAPSHSYQAPEQTYQQPQQTYQQPKKTYQAPSAYEPEPSYSAPSHYEKKEEETPFNYHWEVNEGYNGNVYSHDSQSDGKTTEGEYRVLLPDGRTQIVKYTANDYTGFLSEVKYEGKVKAYEHSKQTYQQPEQTYQEPEQTYQQPEQRYNY